MAWLINNDLIWISTPKCASISIDRALKNSNLKLQKYKSNKIEDYFHISLNNCLSEFGNKESVCITRDWFERWLSGLNYVWDVIELHWGFTPICKWEDVDNEFIYKTFNTDFLNYLHQMNIEGYDECILRLLKIEDGVIPTLPKQLSPVVMVLISEKYYKSNSKCTYEFDIKDIHKFVDFIENRFGEKLILNKLNNSTKRPNKIIVNDELKTFIWNKFEMIYDKKTKLI